jgi:signal transduction histidine kinase
MDRRARRTLHDEVLPGLHTALLEISALPREQPAVQDAIDTLTRAHRQIADLIHQVASTTPALGGAENLADAIRIMLHGEFKDEFDTATLDVRGQPGPIDALVEEVVFYAAREALRNAAVHGRHHGSSHPLCVDVRVSFEDGLTIVIADDGVGLDANAERPGGHSGGAKGGLALHSTMLAVIGGVLVVDQGVDRGAVVTIHVPHEAS